MSDATLVLLVLAAGTYAVKAAVPLALGNRTLPAWVDALAIALPAPLLMALIVTSTVVDGKTFALDAKLAGVAAAVVALSRRANFIVVVVAAAAATALARAAGWS